MKLILFITDVGGPVALHTVLSEIPSSIQCPIVVLPSSEVGLLESSAAALRRTTSLPIVMMQPHQKLDPGCVYFGIAGTVYRVANKTGMLTLDAAMVGHEEDFVRRSIESLASSLGGELVLVFLSGRGRRTEITAACNRAEESGCRILILSRSETLVFDMGQLVLTECPSALELSACEISAFLASETSALRPPHPQKPSIRSQ
jgi:two-component system, chemotaxis family, protein-glutamate methylesterase/glutaminase